MSPSASLLQWYLATLRRTRWRRKAIVVLPGLACLIVFGPFATYIELPLAMRALYWTATLFGVGLFMHLIVWPLLHVAELGHWPRAAVLALGAGLAAIPGTGVVYLTEWLFRGVSLETVGHVGIWAMVTMMGMVITSVQYFEEVFGSNRPAPRSAASADLPDELRGHILSVSTQDHYLEIVRPGGATLVRMRFSDALDALAGAPGARIHRSHWIAESALAEIGREDGRPVAVLKDGRKLPISRTYLADAQALLDGDGDAMETVR